MSKKQILRALAATLILALLLTNAAFAEKVFVMENTEAYASPDSAGKSYGTIEAGTLLTIEAAKSGWAKVSKDGKKGYVSTENLALVKAFNGETVYVSEDATLLSNITTEEAVKSVKTGDAVRLYATAGEWAYIKHGSEKGFLEIASLTTQKPHEDDDKSVTAYTAIDGAKVYKNYSGTLKVRWTLPVNTEVTVTAYKNGWCRVMRDGKSGYMKKTALSYDKVDVPVEKTFTAYVSADNVKAYESYTTTSSVLKILNVNDEVTVTAYNADWCRVEAGGKVAYIKKANLATEKTETPKPEPTPAPKPTPKPEPEAPSDGTSTVKPAKGTAVEMDWWTSDIRTIFSVGTVANVTDVETGIAWQEKRFGGTNHADTQPVTAADTAAMKAACGSWSWTRRAIFVTIDGVNYAASMNCMPHGSDSISDNDFNGHHCIHFTNSRTHGGNKLCPLHQGAIRKAAAAKL